MPITISCFAFHPLIARFIGLWRFAQAASDCLVFFLSFLCCQCGNLQGAPLESHSDADSASSTAFKIMPVEVRVDPESRLEWERLGVRCQHNTPGPEAGDFRPDGEYWEIIDVYSNVPIDPLEDPSTSRRVSTVPEDMYPSVHKK